MAVDLGDLIESLRREVNSPGNEAFPNATDDDFVGHLEDAFWETVLDGLISGTAYTAADGLITQIDPPATPVELGRDLQQIIVLYAGIRILRNELRNLNTGFRSKAGPVEFETTKSAQLLKDLLSELQERRKILLTRLGDLGSVDTYYIDAIVNRDYSIQYGDTPWLN